MPESRDSRTEVGWPRGWCQCYGYKPQDFKKFTRCRQSPGEPMLKLYFFYAGIMITASHSPVDQDGFKLEPGWAPLLPAIPASLACPL